MNNEEEKPILVRLVAGRPTFWGEIRDMVLILSPVGILLLVIFLRSYFNF